MNYTEPSFLVILFFCFTSCLLFPKLRVSFLIIYSFIFYSWLNLTDAIIFLFYIGIIYSLVHWSLKFNRNIYLYLGIIFSVFHLLIWKYNEFIGFHVPLGISFYTLQSIGYLIDLKNKQTQVFSFKDFLFFKSFFPQLLAGPIVRSKSIQEQLKKSKFFSITNWSRGIAWFSIGFFQKIFIADQVALYVNQIFLSPSRFSFETLVAGGLGFILQINCDFSGYSHMAVGLGLLFGFKLPFNFLSPVFSQSPIEVWSRWHVTLTSFMRDYIFNPFIAKYGSMKIATYFGLLTIFILTGMWHDISLKFFVWGIYCAILFVVSQRFIFSRFNHFLKKIFPKFIRIPLSICITLLTSFISMILFRSVDLNHFYVYMKSLTNLDVNTTIPSAFEYIFGLFIFELIISLIVYYDLLTKKRVLLQLFDNKITHLVGLKRKKKVVNSILILVSLVLILSTLFFSRHSTVNNNSFIYFQF